MDGAVSIAAGPPGADSFADHARTVFRGEAGGADAVFHAGDRVDIVRRGCGAAGDRFGFSGDAAGVVSHGGVYGGVAGDVLFHVLGAAGGAGMFDGGVAGAVVRAGIVCIADHFAGGAALLFPAVSVFPGVAIDCGALGVAGMVASGVVLWMGREGNGSGGLAAVERSRGVGNGGGRGDGVAGVPGFVFAIQPVCAGIGGTRAGEVVRSGGDCGAMVRDAGGAARRASLRYGHWRGAGGRRWCSC